MTPGDLPLLGPSWPETRESVDAGGYYCAHLLWVGASAAASSPDVLRDEAGDPLAGFIHVPADPWTLRAVEDSEAARVRHDATIQVVGAVLRGGWETAVSSGAAGLRALVTGFGPFREVANNPTGAFVRDPDALEAAVGRAMTPGRTARFEDELTEAHSLVGVTRGSLQVYARSLTVDDDCLARGGAGALRTLLAATRAQLWVGLGVSRSPHYRVEVRPSDVALDLNAGDPQHTAGLAERTELPANRSLVRALVRGTEAIDGAPTS